MIKLNKIDHALGFGSYQARSALEVPLSYVRWMYENDVIEYADGRSQLRYLQLVRKALNQPKGELITSMHASMPFGKFKDETLTWIALERPDYFCWLVAEEVIRCTDRNFNAVLALAMSKCENYTFIDYVRDGVERSVPVRVCDDIRYDKVGNAYGPGLFGNSNMKCRTTTGRTTTRGFQPVFNGPRVGYESGRKSERGFSTSFGGHDHDHDYDYGYEGDG